MVIYLDTLIFINIIIDYLLLCTTGLILKRNYSVIRTILASLIGGVESLYIFVQTDYMILDIVFKIFSCGLIILIANGLKKGFFLSYLLFLGLSFTLNGAVTLIYELLGPSTFYSENFINYFNISPVLIIFLTILIYISVKIVQRILSRNKKIYTAHLILNISSKEFKYRALVDSGNSIYDPFGDSMVFIVDNAESKIITDKIPEKLLEIRKRIVPVRTVTNSCILNAIRFDKAMVVTKDNKFIFNNPIIAFSNEKLEIGFKAIIPMHALNRFPD